MKKAYRFTNKEVTNVLARYLTDTGFGDFLNKLAHCEININNETGKIDDLTFIVDSE